MKIYWFDKRNAFECHRKQNIPLDPTFGPVFKLKICRTYNSIAKCLVILISLKPLTEMAFIDNLYVISVQKHKACCLKYKLAKRYLKKHFCRTYFDRSAKTNVKIQTHLFLKRRTIQSSNNIVRFT